MDSREIAAQYAAKRLALARTHDLGAGVALADVVSEHTTVRCGSYCYGGSPVIDVMEALADLADEGWRLVRTSPSTAPEGGDDA